MSGNIIPSSGPQGIDLHQDLSLQQGGAYDVPPPDSSDGVQWGRYISALKRYRWFMLMVVLLGTGIGIGITRFIDPEYVARSTLMVSSGGGKGGPIQSKGLVAGNAWIQLLQSFAVIDTVVLKQSLFVVPNSVSDSAAFRGFSLNYRRFVGGKFQLKLNSDGTRYTLTRSGGIEVDNGSVGDSVGRKAGFYWQPAKRALGRDRTIKFEILNPREASNGLLQRFNAGMAQESDFLRLSLRDVEPHRAAATLNAIDSQFVSLAADLKKRQVAELSVILKTQLDTVRSQLEGSENRLKNYQIQIITEPTEQIGVSPGLASTSSQSTSEYFQKKMQADAVRKDREAIEQILARLKTGESTVDAFQTIAIVRTSPNLSAALSELSQKESEERALLYRYTEEHKAVQDVRAMQKTLREETIPAYANALVTQLKAQETGLNNDLNSAAVDLRKIPERAIEEGRLTREVSGLTVLVNDLNARYQSNLLAEKSSQPDVSILDDAQPPQKPTSNTAPKIILMAFGASLGAAFALAILLDLLDKRFRYPEQVSKELGLSILGAIPGIKRSNGRQLKAEEAAQVVEAFRTVRLNLAHSYGAAGPVTLTISSPGSGDGKSLVSSNLALSFAEAGYRTLLVDGDIRRGELHRMFSLDRKPGLLDYLVGDATMDSIVRPSSHEGLSVIPCGTRRQQGPELLGSAAMSHLMAEMKTRYNVIIVDSPPLGAGIDPFVLGTATGHMLMVFRSGETDRAMAEAKLKLLDRLPVRVLGAVLNDIQADGVYKYYSYLYGYTSDEEGTRQLAAQTADGGDAEVGSKS
ncbi:MAG: polysaccharide biosynthesis tyrosine autokinase [Gemmatimonadota bacterium]